MSNEVALSPQNKIAARIERMKPEFAAALPAHIPLERFKRVVQTAINSDPNLTKADLTSLLAACMRAAQDGLLPDKREGALVCYRDQVQWMPMVYGIIKKMRNSGELSSIVAHEVYQKDKFEYILGDEEKIIHEPYLGASPGQMIAVYAIAHLKDGTIQREVMTREQVEKIRQSSKTPDAGPWKSWYEQMARKAVIRRLSKYLPMSTDVERMLEEDDIRQIDHEPKPQNLDQFEDAPLGLAAPAQDEITDATFDEQTGEIHATPFDALLSELMACKSSKQQEAFLAQNKERINSVLADNPDAQRQWLAVLDERSKKVQAAQVEELI